MYNIFLISKLQNTNILSALYIKSETNMLKYNILFIYFKSKNKLDVKTKNLIFIYTVKALYNQKKMVATDYK